jgi:hypothetical protein
MSIKHPHDLELRGDLLGGFGCCNPLSLLYQLAEEKEAKGRVMKEWV